MNVCARCRSALPPATNLCASCGFPNPMLAVPSGKKSSSTIILVVVLVLALPGALGVFAVLGIYGVRKYIAGAKTAEARNGVAMIAKFTAERFEQTHRVCPSASNAVPALTSQISARKYMSTTSEWESDAGWACVGFAMTTPQYFQYRYEATETGFRATARGDLDGDGKLSTFALGGQVVDGKLVIAPQIEEIDPEE